MLPAIQYLCNRMEQHLLEDVAISQAKIISLASPDSPTPGLVIAINLSDMTQQSAQSAVRAARKLLCKKMADVGGKAVVPNRWASPAPLPLDAAGNVDEFALRQSLLLDAAAEEDTAALAAAAEARPETLEDKILRVIGSVLHLPADQLVQTRSFAQNGGDSFTAIELFQRLMREDISLRVPDIMRSETLAELPSLVISRHPMAAPVQRPIQSAVHDIKLPESQSIVSVTQVFA